MTTLPNFNVGVFGRSFPDHQPARKVLSPKAQAMIDENDRSFLTYSRTFAVVMVATVIAMAWLGAQGGAVGAIIAAFVGNQITQYATSRRREKQNRQNIEAGDVTAQKAEQAAVAAKAVASAAHTAVEKAEKAIAAPDDIAAIVEKAVEKALQSRK